MTQEVRNGMNDRSGLSIFDDDSSNSSRSSGGSGSGNDAMQVFSAVGGSGSGSAGAAGSGANAFPVVRRGGYDPAAVDRHLHTLAGEKAGLTASLNDAKARLKQLEKQVADLKTQVAENEAPSYAGLWARQRDAPSRRGAGRRGPRRARIEADSCADTPSATPSGCAHASRDAEDMKIVQLKELEETRSRMLADAEQDRALARGEAEDILAKARREAEQAPPRRGAGDQHLHENARREAEQARAAVGREVQEARRTSPSRRSAHLEAAEHHTNATSETANLEPRGGGPRQRRRAARPRGDLAGHRPPRPRPERGRAPAHPRPPRGGADRRLRTDPGQQLHLGRAGRRRARAPRDPGRGRPRAEAPRRDRGPARCAA